MRSGFWISLVLIFVSEWAAAGSRLSLSDFLRSVETQSPDLKIEKSRTEESSSRASGVRIPPPMVGIMQMKEDGRTNPGIEISQEIPFPTKISTEKELRSFESELQKENQKFRKKEVLSSARTAYFEFWNSFEKTLLIKEKRDWLKKHARLARTTTRSDSSAQIHLLAVESDVDMLENEVLESGATLHQKRNALKSFSPALDVDQIEPDIPQIQIIQPNPSLKLSKSRLKEIELKLSEAQKNYTKKSYFPDLFIRYRGYNGNEMTAKSEEAMIGITLPFAYFWQPNAELSEASARQQRAQAELQKVQVDSEATFKSLEFKIESLEKQLATIESRLLPQAQKRMKLVENLSPRSMEGLEEHRNVMISYFDLRLKALDVRMELERSIGDLMALLSKDEGDPK